MKKIANPKITDIEKHLNANLYAFSVKIFPTRKRNAIYPTNNPIQNMWKIIS